MERLSSCAAGTAALLILSGVAGGCAWRGIGRSVGRGAAEAGVERLRDPEVYATIRRLSDSSLAAVTASFEARLRPSVEATVRGVLDSADVALAHAEENLARNVEGRLSRSVTTLVSSNLAAAGVEARRQVRETTQELGQHLQADLAPILRESIVEATEAFMHSLSAGVRTELAAAAESALVKTVRASVRAGTKESEPFLNKILFAVGGVLLTVLALYIWWLRKERQRSLAAIDVIAAEISRGAPAIKASIKAVATERGVEGWLHDQLARRGHV